MRQFLRKFRAALLGQDAEADGLRKQLAATIRDLTALRREKDAELTAARAHAQELGAARLAKEQELACVWEHAHKLDASLQRLDAFVQAGGHLAPGVGSGAGYDFLTHAFGPEPPSVPSVIVPDIEPTESDVRIAARLLRAYHRAAEEEERRGCAPAGDCWAWIKTLQAEFFATLRRNDPAELAAYLCNMGRRDATIGTDQGNLEYDKLRTDPAHRDRLALRFKDKLLSLAEAVGAAPCENPEQGAWGRALHADPDVLAGAIAGAFGLDIAPPPIDGGLLKVPTSHGLFCERDCQGLYVAWTLRQTLGSLGGAAVCEIGAGSGRAAYWSRRLGCGSYTIFDLPHTNVVHGFYLLKALAEDRVFLYGEPPPSQRGGTTILPYFATDAAPARAFDLVLNQDSFPEISAPVVRGYLNWIRSATRRYFLSLNHESKPIVIGGGGRQSSVPELVAEVGGFRRVWRAPDWLRRGYTIELYEVGEAG
ncbi:putative sugar O-methyltransferase [Gemmata sp. JC673]|uniref:Sugar O-methyltransferase n=1 Tax=Gemmata algarum TaxID=2975278 RepID=A0ABU5F2C3_9BACT|nr:putative sugar O-methyltransferase [Gemmata algarum]MDY3561556.1 putative sugar O-methyltransferase [Gemmata algarum]